MEKSMEFLQDMFPIDHQIIYDTYISKNKNIDETISSLISMCNFGENYPPTYEEAMSSPYNSTSTNSSESSKRKDSRRNLEKKEWKLPFVGKLSDDFLRVPNEISSNSASIGLVCKSCSKLKNIKNDTNSSPSGSYNSPLTASEIENIDFIIRRRMEDNVSQTRFATLRGAPDQDSIQYLDDERLALMLQNQEFLIIIKSDPEFQQALKKDHSAASSTLVDNDFEDIWQERADSIQFRPQDSDFDYGYEQSDIVDPTNLWSDQKLPSSDNDIKRMCKAMGKASRNRINALARRFISMRRRKSSKSYNHINMDNVSPIFENENELDSNRWESESTQQLIIPDDVSDNWMDFSENYRSSVSPMHRTDSSGTLI